MSGSPLRVVLCWHMHQPEYRSPLDGHWLAPWAWLHALKDYADMAAHLEACPQARAVVSLTPVLLDQVEAVGIQVGQLQAGTGTTGDALLDTLAMPVLDLDAAGRRSLAAACLRAQRQRMIERFPAYRRLADIAQAMLGQEAGFAYLDEGFVFDLLVWYLLAWMGESVRNRDHRCAMLVAKGSHFDVRDRAVLLAVIHDVLVAVPDRYRALAAQGRVELATVPATHPLLPLLNDLGAARQAQPTATLPVAEAYPGGADRVRVQLADARHAHAMRFGEAPQGCWSPEAAIDAPTLAALAQAGFGWTVSSQAVLGRSLPAGTDASDRMHRPCRLGGQGTVVFFRDDVLSDRIGFVYKDWAPEAAVADLLQRMEAVAALPAAGERVLTLALDGENAWEHYPENAHRFLGELYAGLAAHPRLQATTFAACLADPEVSIRTIERLVAGSWVGGDLGTWIGSKGKNRAWDMLVEAKRHFDLHGGAAMPAALRQLAVCEGSDWFWWPDGDHAETEVAAFERLFRVHLAGLYRLLGCEPPEYLGHPFTHGAAGSGPVWAMRPHRAP